ncbi:beta-1,6-N-acetylglucosaminyltransferase [Bacillus massilinigeriensis]|uniref:beta-1,6-N-acetylglucosaminyltransferase n=1 Tax=Bacillus massilionigeriensis TaxID=1805475 RepID=UPI00096ADD6A|nr:beta-1,6-N-acetylglucosaminyltransferase [Bacillus massilionigeriensis]
MNLAYIIQAHNGKKQLVELIDTLLDETTDVYLHIDKKSSLLYLELEEIYQYNSKVYLLGERESVNWSGFSQVLATLKLMNAVKESNKNYDYVSLISGQDFPIKTKQYIKSFLLENKGKEFIEYRDIAQHYWRLKCYNFFRENRNNRKLYMRIIDNLIRYPQKLFIRRNNFINLDLYFGSQWFTITYNCMLYILEFLKENPDYMKQFSFTSCPDEHFFQILIMNSKFKDKVINNNLRYIDWSSGKNSPEVLTSKDYESLKRSDKLFARKFDINLDINIIEKIIEDIS